MNTIFAIEQEFSPVMTQEQRIFTRMPFDHAVRWSDLSGDNGHATVRDVSRGGMSLTMRRYMRPGPVMTVVFDKVAFNGKPVELDMAVAWCKPTSTPDQFLAGFRIIDSGVQTLAASSEVFYAAMGKGAVGA